MKSIMEEASSVSKAIEKAWARADKPASFSVKVLEHEVKNFFGLTSKPAKIAFYFEEVLAQPSRSPRGQQQQQSRRPERPAERVHDRTVPAHTQTRTSPDQQRKQINQQQQHRQQRPQPEQKPFKKEMIQKSDVQEARTENFQEQSTAAWPTHVRVEAERWLNKAVTALRSDARLECETHNNELQVAVNCSLALNGNERLLCSSLAHLLMQAMRNQFKNETRGLRVHIKTAAS